MSVINAFTSIALTGALCLAAPAQAADKHAVANFSSCAKPHYPAASLSAKHEGTVSLAFLVDTGGKVLEAKVNESSGYEPLDVAARDAVRLCKFAPAVKDGKAVESWAKVKYIWTLK